MRIEFTVPGQPVPKGRPRVTYHGTYTPKKTADYERYVRECWLEQSGERIPDGLPIKLTLVAFIQIPKSYSKKKREAMHGVPHTSKPDCDNLVKSVTDALQDRSDRKKGTIQKNAFKDDSMIYSVTAYKFFSNVPRVKVILEA